MSHSTLKTQDALLDDVFRGIYESRLPPHEPSLAELIDRYRMFRAENDLDGNDLDTADEIRVRLMADLGLSKAQCDALGEAL